MNNLDSKLLNPIIARKTLDGDMIMEEIECPTCESVIEIPDKPKLWDKIECPLCGERLQIVSVKPLIVEYYEKREPEEAEKDDDYVESTEDLFDRETEYKQDYRFEDEENQSFELPEKSTLFENLEEEIEPSTEDET